MQAFVRRSDQPGQVQDCENGVKCLIIRNSVVFAALQGCLMLVAVA